MIADILQNEVIYFGIFGIAAILVILFWSEAAERIRPNKKRERIFTERF